MDFPIYLIYLEAKNGNIKSQMASFNQDLSEEGYLSPSVKFKNKNCNEFFKNTENIIKLKVNFSSISQSNTT